MARQTKVELIDDISGGPASQTVTFSVDGVSYGIVAIQVGSMSGGSHGPVVNS
jgi:hypothetical protein